METKMSASVKGVSLPISAKTSVNICNVIRNKPLLRAKQILQDAVDLKRAIPMTRYNMDLGHKKTMAAGSYPFKAGNAFLKLLNSLQANAENKGMNVNSLVIVKAMSNRAETRWRPGRKGRAKAKTAHVELIVEEKNVETKKKDKK